MNENPNFEFSVTKNLSADHRRSTGDPSADRRHRLAVDIVVMLIVVRCHNTRLAPSCSSVVRRHRRCSAPLAASPTRTPSLPPISPQPHSPQGITDALRRDAQLLVLHPHCYGRPIALHPPSLLPLTHYTSSRTLYVVMPTFRDARILVNAHPPAWPSDARKRGALYVLEVVLPDGRTVFKIGHTNRPAKRLAELAKCSQRRWGVFWLIWDRKRLGESVFDNGRGV